MQAPFLKRQSPIHGFGLFANRDFCPGMILFKAVDLECKVQELGMWVNHSRYPNVTLHREPDGWYLVSVLPIRKGDEILANYRASPPCIDKPLQEWDSKKN